MVMCILCLWWFSLVYRLTPGSQRVACLYLIGDWLLLAISYYYHCLSDNQRWPCTRVENQMACHQAGLFAAMGIIVLSMIRKCCILYLRHEDTILPYDNKFWWKTKFGKLANHYQTAKYKFLQFYFHIIIIIIIIGIYVAFLLLRRLLFGAPFPLCIKSKHAAEIFQGTCPITFALFLTATAYGSNALLYSV